MRGEMGPAHLTMLKNWKAQQRGDGDGSGGGGGDGNDARQGAENAQVATQLGEIF